MEFGNTTAESLLQIWLRGCKSAHYMQILNAVLRMHPPSHANTRNQTLTVMVAGDATTIVCVESKPTGD